MKEQIGTLIRAALKVGGGYAVAAGVVGEQGAEELIGALMVIVGVVWGAVEAKQAAKAKAQS